MASNHDVAETSYHTSEGTGWLPQGVVEHLVSVPLVTTEKVALKPEEIARLYAGIDTTGLHKA